MTINAQNEKRGRKASQKNAQLRRAVVKTLLNIEDSMSTKEIAKATKQSKTRVVVALRWAMTNGHVIQVGSKNNGRGRPVATWKAEA